MESLMSKTSSNNRLTPSVGYLLALLMISVVAILVLFSQRGVLAAEPTFRPVDLTCQEFSKYRMKAPTRYSNSLNYVLGYLKAAQDMKLMRKVNLRHTEGFLFQYCYSNPKQTLQAAIESLMEPKMRAAYRKGSALKLAARSKRSAMAVRNPLAK